MQSSLRFTLLILFAAAALALPSFPISAQGLTSMRNYESQHAKPGCPKGDPVVWVNEKGTVYFPESSKYYGYTPNGKWACQSDAIKSGAMLTKTVPQPVTAPSGVLPSGAPSSAAPAAPASAAPTPK